MDPAGGRSATDDLGTNHRDPFHFRIKSPAARCYRAAGESGTPSAIVMEVTVGFQKTPEPSTLIARPNQPEPADASSETLAKRTISNHRNCLDDFIEEPWGCPNEVSQPDPPAPGR